MKFLIDNALSPKLADLLKNDGFDVVHVRKIGLQHSSDKEIFDYAADKNRIIISADTDFGLLLSQRNKQKPSVIIFRKGAERDPLQQGKLLKLNLSENVKEALHSGSIVIIEQDKLRIKSLPLHK